MRFSIFRNRFLIAVALCFIGHAQQESGRIFGLVKDQAGTPIANAIVTVRGNGNLNPLGTAHTDVEGRFSISGMPPQTAYDLFVQASGFQAIALTKMAKKDVQVCIVMAAADLGGVLVLLSESGVSPVELPIDHFLPEVPTVPSDIPKNLTEGKEAVGQSATGRREISEKETRQLSVSAQSPAIQRKFDSTLPPRFEEFPVSENWSPPPAALKLTTPSETMFKTRLTEAWKEPPNFAGHYRMTYWGCGSECAAAALLDLETGDVIQPPLATPDATRWDRWIMCAASFEGTGDNFHVNSRLMIVRCGMNYSERLQKNIPDTYYFVLERGRFRQLLFVSGKQSGR